MPISVLLAVAIPAALKPVWVREVAGYRLEKWKREDPEREIPETLYLKDRRGRVVTTLREFRVSLLFPDRPSKLFDLNHDGVPEIVLTTWTGGAHASLCYFVWSLGRYPRCLLAYDKGNISDQHDFDLIDLDGDGVPEIRSWYDGFAYTVGASNWQGMPVVLKLEHGRYVERTTRFPKLLAESARVAWKDLQASDLKANPASWSGPSSYAINLIALADLSGTRPRVWRRFRSVLPPKTYAWLKKREPDILAIERARKDRYVYPAAYSKGPVRWPHRSSGWSGE